MATEREREQRSGAPALATGTDAAHLDEDAEALEDPVHCGDAKHQHDVHEQASRTQQ